MEYYINTKGVVLKMKQSFSIFGKFSTFVHNRRINVTKKSFYKNK